MKRQNLRIDQQCQGTGETKLADKFVIWEIWNNLNTVFILVDVQ